jgi:hypothetical protein
MNLQPASVRQNTQPAVQVDGCHYWNDKSNDQQRQWDWFGQKRRARAAYGLTIADRAGTESHPGDQRPQECYGYSARQEQSAYQFVSTFPSA